MKFLAVDLAPARVTVAEFSATAGGEIVQNQVAVEQLEREPTEPGGEEALTKAFAKLAARFPQTRSCVLALSGPYTLTKWLRISVAEWAQHDRLMPFEAERNLPCPLEEMAWSYVSAFQGTDEVDVMLCAAKTELMRIILAASAAAKWSIESAVPGGFALAQGLRGRLGNVGGSATLIDVGAHATQVVVIGSQRFFLRTLYRRSPNETVGAEPAEALSAFAGKVSSEVAQSLAFCRRRPGSEDVARLHVLGPERVAAAVSDRLRNTLRLPVEPLPDETASLAISGIGVNATADVSALLILEGLASSTAKEPRAMLNLLPAAEVAAHASRRRQPWLLATLVLAIGTCAPVAWHYHSLGRAQEAKLLELEERLVPVRARAARNAANLRRLAQVEEQIATLERVWSERDDWMRLLADLQERFTQVEEAWIDRMQIVERERLFISGRMLDRQLARDSKGEAQEQRLFKLLLESPHVGAVEDATSESAQLGLVRFAAILVLQPEVRR